MTDSLERLRTALAGRYAVEGEVGHGGMATVYRARDLKHGRTVALKVLRPELAANLGVERFLREIEIAAQLTHPHILSLYDSGEAGGMLYYVMPYIEGESLRDRLRRERQLPVADAVQIACEVASALAYAHSHNVIHRDIKPENILLSGGEAVVADFGIARAIAAAGGEQITETGFAVGTPAYMSPEQAGGSRELDGRTDVYALACVLYEMLAGDPPFSGTNPAAIIARKAVESPARLCVVRESVSPSLERVVLKALARVPADRFTTPAEFAEALRREVGAPIPGSSPALQARIPPRKMLLTGLGAAALVGLGFLGLVLARRSPTGAAQRGANGLPTSVAVLYLENNSPDTADVVFGDGITEELIARLSQVEGLRVASRFASLRYRGRRTPDPRAVGPALGVRYVLHGTVRRIGEQVRVAVEITDTTGGFNVWGQTYDGTLRRIFALQDSVAVQVAEAVRGRLNPKEQARIARPAMRTTPEAYEAYLRARAVIRARSPEPIARAIDYYRRAVGLDPDFAAAYAGLAQAYVLAENWGPRATGLSGDSLAVLARVAVRRALALDSTNPQGWIASAMVAREETPRLAPALVERALSLDSSDAEAWHQLAFAYFPLGLLDTAIAAEERAIARDPFYAFAYASLAQVLNLAGRPEDAVAWANRGLAVDSSNAPLYWHAADAYLRLGRYDEARRAVKRGLALGLPGIPAGGLLVIADLIAGDTAAARAAVQHLSEEGAGEFALSPGGLNQLQAGFLSAVYAQLRDVAGAVLWFGRMTRRQQRYYHVLFERHWFWEPVRSDPRFQAVLASSR